MSAALPFFAPGGRRPDPESAALPVICVNDRKITEGHTLHTQSAALLKIKEMRTGLRLSICSKHDRRHFVPVEGFDRTRNKVNQLQPGGNEGRRLPCLA
jgi:hypothetical protein